MNRKVRITFVVTTDRPLRDLRETTLVRLFTVQKSPGVPYEFIEEFRLRERPAVTDVTPPRRQKPA